MPEWMKTASLERIMLAAKRGEIGEPDIAAYLRLWNAGPCRFTQAVFDGRRIVQIDREKGSPFYAHLFERYGATMHTA